MKRVAMVFMAVAFLAMTSSAAAMTVTPEIVEIYRTSPAGWIDSEDFSSPVPLTRGELDTEAGPACDYEYVIGIWDVGTNYATDLWITIDPSTDFPHSEWCWYYDIVDWNDPNYEPVTCSHVSGDYTKWGVEDLDESHYWDFCLDEDHYGDTRMFAYKFKETSNSDVYCYYFDWIFIDK